MSGYAKVERDRYGFKFTTVQHEVAKLLDEGLGIEDIVARKYLRQTVHSTRYEMKKREKKWPDGYPAPKAEAPTPGVESKASKKGGVSATRFPDRFDAFGFKRGSNLSEIASRIASGETSAAVIASGENKFQVYKAAGRVNRMPNVKPASKTTALVPHQPKAVTPKRKPNGLDMPVTVPMLEVVVHDGKGREIPIFSSVDVFPHIYQRVIRKLGLG